VVVEGVHVAPHEGRRPVSDAQVQEVETTIEELATAQMAMFGGIRPYAHEQDEWLHVASMGTSREDHAAAVADGVLYVFCHEK
jgi:hypothetical protein